MWSFQSPSHGLMSLEDVVENLITCANKHPQDEFRLIVGTDSQPKTGSRQVTFVTAIILHHVGKGACYYFHREYQHHMYSLRQRMFTEASYSLQIGSMLTDMLSAGGSHLRPELHLDIGENGATKQLLREIVAWITASGYEARTKPDSFGASKVADRYTRV